MLKLIQLKYFKLKIIILFENGLKDFVIMVLTLIFFTKFYSNIEVGGSNVEESFW